MIMCLTGTVLFSSHQSYFTSRFHSVLPNPREFCANQTIPAPLPPGMLVLEIFIPPGPANTDARTHTHSVLRSLCCGTFILSTINRENRKPRPRRELFVWCCSPLTLYPSPPIPIQVHFLSVCISEKCSISQYGGEEATRNWEESSARASEERA
uniref:(northern house mosquito) hypothetical protein n=1 Tax=Culex pipiens TaxID=7175 RepID=A0A8D8B821_CULPI